MEITDPDQDLSCLTSAIMQMYADMFSLTIPALSLTFADNSLTETV
jgi:hypothetical protein